jgi:uncharacterized membrane protein YfhO
MTTPGPALVVLSQAYYHNWTASVDGVAVPLWRANYAFQAIEVPPGRHNILLAYKDRALLLGGILSSLSALACVGGWLFLSAAGRTPPNYAKLSAG